MLVAQPFPASFRSILVFDRSQEKLLECPFKLSSELKSISADILSAFGENRKLPQGPMIGDCRHEIKARAEVAMIHHVSVGTNDVRRSKRFFDAVLPVPRR